MSGYAEHAIKHLDIAEGYTNDLAAQAEATIAIGWALLAIVEQLAQFEAVRQEEEA